MGDVASEEEGAPLRRAGEERPGDEGRRRPALLLDVMGTLVRDPFYEDMPKFFGLTLKELLQQKHPSAWVEFECGHLSEPELVAKFFADGRPFDYEGLKRCMRDGYRYLDGVEDLLQRLKGRGYSMHAFTNYPCWYRLIEDKLQLSQYLDWTFISCQMGKRKPDAEIYLDAARALDLEPAECIFVDDRSVNVEKAAGVGMAALLFRSAEQLESDLAGLGVNCRS